MLPADPDEIPRELFENNVIQDEDQADDVDDYNDADIDFVDGDDDFGDDQPLFDVDKSLSLSEEADLSDIEGTLEEFYCI